MTVKSEEDLKSDLEYLVANPDKTMGSTYHDAGSCWELIEILLTEIRRLRELNKV